MTSPDGDIQRMLAEATIISAAASFMATLPQWMRDVFTIHKTEVARLREAGEDAVADLVALHEPIIDDAGILCADGDGRIRVVCSVPAVAVGYRTCRLIGPHRSGGLSTTCVGWIPSRTARSQSMILNLEGIETHEQGPQGDHPHQRWPGGDKEGYGSGRAGPRGPAVHVVERHVHHGHAPSVGAKRCAVTA